MEKMAKNAGPEANSATIDEALDRTHFGKFNYIAIALSGAVLINVVLESVGISFALPVLECDLNLTYQQQGILGAVTFTGVIVSSHFWGFLADTTGRKNIMKPGLLLQFVATVLSAFSVNFPMLAILRFLSGVFLSAASATVYAYLGELHSQQYRSRAIIFSAVFSAIFAIMIPFLAWLFINRSYQFYVPLLGITYRPWRSFIVALGVPGFICGLVLCLMPESPKFLLAVGKEEESLKVLKFIHRLNTSGNSKLKNDKFEITHLLPDADTPISKNKPISSNRNVISTVLISMWRQTAPLFSREHIRKTVLASLIQYIGFFTAHGVYMWFPYILNSSMRFTQQYDEPVTLCDIIRFTQGSNFTAPNEKAENCVVHLETSTFKHTLSLELIYVSFLLAISYSISKIGRKTMLFIIMITCGGCGILALIVKIPLVAIYLHIVLLCAGLGQTVVNAIVVDIYPTNLRAMAVCISLMMGRIGSVSGSNVLGLLIDTNCEAALYTSAISLIIAGFLGFFLPKSNVPSPPNKSKEADDSV